MTRKTTTTKATRRGLPSRCTNCGSVKDVHFEMCGCCGCCGSYASAPPEPLTYEEMIAGYGTLEEHPE